MSFTTGKTIAVEFDPADKRPGRFGCRITCDGIPFERIADAATPEAARIEATIRTTAQRAGFYFVSGNPTPIKSFLTTQEIAGTEPRKLVDAFRDQGFAVEISGAYRAGRIASTADLKSETPADVRAAQRAEERHIRDRQHEREASEADAIQRLRTAARAEDMRLEVVFDYSDGRNERFRLYKGGVPFEKLAAERDDEDAQAFVKDMKTVAKRNGVFVYDRDTGLFQTSMLSDRNAAGRFVAAVERYARDLGGSARIAGAYDRETGRCTPKAGAVTGWEPDEGAAWQRPNSAEIAAARDRQAEARRSRTNGSRAPAFA
jgi:hypothetical protein